MWACRSGGDRLVYGWIFRCSSRRRCHADELIVVVRRQAGQLAVQDRQISEMAGQLAQLMEANEALAGKLARLEHLLSRNSGNSSNPPSRDDDPGKPTPPDRQRGRGGPKRPRGKQRGAPGSPKAAVTAVMLSTGPGTWVWWTATSSTRSRRSR